MEAIMKTRILRHPRLRPAIALACCAWALSAGTPAVDAADHLDGPRLTNNPGLLGNLDINDVYIFKGSTAKNTVLVMTVSPAAGVLGPPTFSTAGAYEFKIENNGDTSEDLTIRFVFGPPGSSGQQSYQFAAVDADGGGRLAGGGRTGRNVKVRGGGMVRAGLFDDPFFFDLNTFNRFKAKALAGDKSAALEFLNRGVKNIPQNFFGGFNVLAIVLEVPSVLLQASRGATHIGVWARTLMADASQFDRMARPAINTVLLPDDRKDAFNSAVPGQDSTFISSATDELTLLFGDAAMAATLAKTLLPDIMTFNTSSAQGFLNGRRLTDDVIDAELGLLTNNAVTSDEVVNDSVFTARFPYLGTPNPKSVAIRSLELAARGAEVTDTTSTATTTTPPNNPTTKSHDGAKSTGGSPKATSTSSAKSSSEPKHKGAAAKKQGGGGGGGHGDAKPKNGQPKRKDADSRPADAPEKKKKRK
jgi:hypothetical protein